jgi:hypothetical protein
MKFIRTQTKLPSRKNQTKSLKYLGEVTNDLTSKSIKLLPY